MPGNDPLQARDEDRTPAEQFFADRLDRDQIDTNKYPAQVDRAALDVLRGIAVGKTDDPTDFGGTIDRFNFDEATGEFYVEGLTEIAGSESTLTETLDEYEPNRIGQLAFQLNALRHTLHETGRAMDIDQALESLLEKTATTAIEQSVKSGGNEGAGLRPLRDTDSVNELVARLFSDPRVDAYAQTLVEQLPDARADSDDLVEQLDEVRMTTPLWEHQRTALERWQQSDQRGYVDMATATGKTVLGLAAMALRYGALHPIDRQESRLLKDNDTQVSSGDSPRILIVAGTDLLLDQWRSEFETHLDIPEARTTPESEDERLIELSWGSIEFRTAQDLQTVAEFSRYDLVILDEAHRYSRGRSSGQGWGELFADLTEGADAILAMSGSVDSGWQGDSEARDALENYLDRCYQYSVAEAKKAGVIADFSWEVRYLPASGDQIDRLVSQTKITTGSYSSADGTLEADQLNISSEKVPSEFVDYNDLRSFVQSNDGNDLRSESTAFDAFASALLARKPLRWNTTPDLDPVADLILSHAPEQKTVALVRSYESARQLASALTDGYGIDPKKVVTFSDSSDDRFKKVKQFNDLSEGVIIGPGDLLGTGVDLPEAEVAVNISRGGVNPSLVQRIGRILRNPKGDKTATFYHLVAQPVDDDAYDDVEDGATLLTQAAEYRALGDTFRESPSYRADDAVQQKVASLEHAGISLLERVEDEKQLVATEAAEKYLRALQAAVYDAEMEADNDRRTPALHTWARGEGTEASDRQFPDRNDAYEEYRLALGPYRAAKAAAVNLYNADPTTIETEDGYEVEFDDTDLTGTAFHNAFERWLNEYRHWRQYCNNRDGSGEPGSLTKYKEEWPEPPANEGDMVSKEAAQKIGISYADSDPIFFPYEDERAYVLPLPDNRYLTIEGIVQDLDVIKSTAPPIAESDSGYKTSVQGEGESITVDSVLLIAIEAQVDDTEAFVTDTISELLKDSIDGSDIDVQSYDPIGSRVSVNWSLPPRHLRLLGALVDETETQFSDVDSLIEAALVRAIEPPTESVELDPILSAAINATTDDSSVSEFVRDATVKKLKQSHGSATSR